MVEEGDLVVCVVEKIEGTTVFVKLPDGEMGAIITSEIAPGRIRNLRDYVVPNKKIVCKVLRVRGGHIDLSLRRVNPKEKKEILTKLKHEQASKSALYQILGEKARKIEEKILNDFESLFEFFAQSKDDEKLLSKYIPSEFQEAVARSTKKRQKQVEVKKILELRCFEEDGILKIKKIFVLDKEFNDLNEKLKITYLSAGKFQIVLKADNYKEANQGMDKLVNSLEGAAKKNVCEFEAREK
jgi:translation initiation factor 2 alpha subunit (eIF-2alpha)